MNTTSIDELIKAENWSGLLKLLQSCHRTKVYDKLKSTELIKLSEKLPIKKSSVCALTLCYVVYFLLRRRLLEEATKTLALVSDKSSFERFRVKMARILATMVRRRIDICWVSL